MNLACLRGFDELCKFILESPTDATGENQSLVFNDQITINSDLPYVLGSSCSK